ncbi:MAG: C-terminal binding protein [Alphaproteobacteria bacterium]|nr:MAG: C-terminal binding protein [Alphaproteobacteria bacterium]
MAVRKVVITDCDHGHVDPERAVLEAAGLRVELARAATEEEVIAAARDAEGMIVQYAAIGDRVLAACPGLRVIARYGVGTDTIDLEAASRRNVAVCNVPGYCEDEVADHALALMLAVLRRIVLHDRHLRAGRWDFRLGGPIRRIRGSRPGIIGCGRIGEALARRARALGMTVLGHDPYRDSWPDWLQPVSLEALLEQSDVVSLHLGLDARTRHLIDAGRLAMMKPGAVLVNTARGGLVDGRALAAALQSGHLSGAGLDVFDPEPIPPDHPIRDCPTAVITPHAGFYSVEALEQLKTGAALAVRRVLVDGDRSHALNADRLRGA